MPIPTLYTLREVANILKLDKRTVQRYVKQGKIKKTPCGNLIRISEQDLKNYMDGTK